MAQIKDQTIVFFDGVCNLCNATVDFLLTYDQTGELMFAPLQGSTAKQLLPHVSLESVIFYEEGQSLSKSRAAFALIRYLGFPWRLLLILRLIPTPIADQIYDLISKYRYTIFGQRSVCRIPNDEIKKRFLD